MSFNDIFFRLLGLKTEMLTCKKLERTSAQIEAFKTWKAAKVYLNWTALFYKAYHYQKAGFPSELRVQLLSDTSRQGAILFYSPSIGSQNFRFLFDLLKERVAALGYTLRSSDVQEVRHKRYLEQVEHYLLVPPASDMPNSSLCDQQYGNINLELIQINKRPGYIRFSANSYADVYFSKPLPFPDLLEKVLQPHELDE